MQILETEYQDIYKGQWLSETKKFLNGTPSEYIIFKVLPGLGATHGELLLYLWRNSIIAEPNVPVIQGKETELDEVTGQLVYPNMLAVYGKTSKTDVIRYLRSDITPKKIMCTPEAFEKKVKPAINETTGFNLYKDFFFLLDECDKLTTESDYRAKIIAPMNDFFLFEHKAMVSATALMPSDPRFAINGFKILEITPKYPYQRKVNLLGTNNTMGTLSEVIKRYDTEVYFIFINSIDVIHAIIKSLCILKECKVFCSAKSVKKIGRMDVENASDILGGFSRYNFLTSRFYSAVDIKLPFKPNVVMLTNVYKAPHSIIDPYTDAVQIIGRFRNGTTRNTHITNFNPTISYQNPDVAKKYIDEGYEEYKIISDRLKIVDTQGGHDTITQATQRIDIAKFIDDDHALMSFMVDNHIYEQKIRSYYRSLVSLQKAYATVKYLVAGFQLYNFAVSDSQLYDLENNKGRSLIIKSVCSILHSYDSAMQGQMIYRLGETIHGVKASHPDIYKDYITLGGYGRMEELKFNQSLITREVKRINQASSLLNPVMVKEIQTWYAPNQDKPSSIEIRQKLKDIFIKYEIKKNVTTTMIQLYYKTECTTDKNNKKVWEITGII